jgi:hypothetical protein
MENASDDDCQRQLEKHQLMKPVPIIQCARDKHTLDEDSPNEKVSNVPVKHFMKRPGTDRCVKKPEENAEEDPVDAGKNEILLNEAAPVGRCRFWSADFVVCEENKKS